MDSTFLQNFWFILIGVFFCVYTILDGFDLGIGMLLPFITKDDAERTVLLRAIGPVWDANEVWLLSGGAALFAAFPLAYASVFSGFYLAVTLLIVAMIFRAVAIEFWFYDEKRKTLWLWACAIGSFLIALLLAVALGNVLFGIPLNARFDFTGNFFTLLRPFPLLIGVTAVCALIMHGAAYALRKTDSLLRIRIEPVFRRAVLAALIAFVLAAGGTFLLAPQWMTLVIPWICAAGALIMLLLMLVRSAGKTSFMFSSAYLLLLWGIAGSVHFPNLANSLNPAYSITVMNASSSLLTLQVMSIIAAVGLPIVAVYSIVVYRIFKGPAA